MSQVSGCGRESERGGAIRSKQAAEHTRSARAQARTHTHTHARATKRPPTMAAPTTLYHLVPEGEWRACQAEKRPYFPATYDQDGFTHMSDNSDVLISIGNHFYKDIAGGYLVLDVDASKLKGEVKMEPAAAVGNKASDAEVLGQKLFPHLYGPIDVDAVAKEFRVVRGDDGTFKELLM